MAKERKKMPPRPAPKRDDLIARADEILARIANGESMREIAEDEKCSPVTIWNALRATDDLAERCARAMELSAEAWLDRGLDAIESALSKSGDVDASAARAYAQECARRAAVRNPRYRDKVDATLSSPTGGPVQVESIVRTIVDARPRPKSADS